MPPPSGSRRLCFKFLPHVFQKRRMIKNVVGVRSSNFLSQTIEIWIVSGSLNCQIFTLECIMLLQTRSCAAFVRVPSPFDLQELIKSSWHRLHSAVFGPSEWQGPIFSQVGVEEGSLGDIRHPRIQRKSRYTVHLCMLPCIFHSMP